MGVTEILLFITSILLVVGISHKESFSYASILLFIAVLIGLAHSIFGHHKWQLYMVYGSFLIAFIVLSVKVIRMTEFDWFSRIGIITLTSVLIILSLLSTIAFPVYELPTPTGDYLIGTESFVIEDETRYEQYGDNPLAHRKIKIQVWYPAETIEGYEKAPWLEDGKPVARALSRDFGLPFFALDHTADILSNSYVNAPISTTLEKYPVIVISHGWRGFKNLHTDFAEELSSHGYIVIGIDHTYGSVATVFEDEIAYLNEEALPDRETTSNFLEYANELVTTYSEDIMTTIDYLEDINQTTSTSRFSEKLDLESIGLVGHSTGGGGGTKAVLNDDRIDAVFGLDSWVEPITEPTLRQGITIPAVFLRSGQWETSYNNDYLYTLINNSSKATLYQIDGTTHFDFSMVYMYSPLTKPIGFSGEINGRYLNTILTTMIRDFFNQTLVTDTYDTIDINAWEEVREIEIE
ncbi:MAG: hypothetical protein K9L74_00160 [Candidatus Izimaplasma sp.]|nr:hypothetical protein [Candidatus Izimaplasma bacterium]